jgi:hypothetical protein
MSSLKVCNRCKTEKELSHFHKDKCSPDGFYTICKCCKKVKTDDSRLKFNEYQKNYRKKKHVEKNKNGLVVSEKRCANCNEIKASTEFGKKVYFPDGLNCYCKPCNRIIDKEYFNKRKELGYKREYTETKASYARAYYEQNKEHLNKLQKLRQRTPEYRAKNKEYRSRVKLATPKWLDKNQRAEMRAIYKSAMARSEFHEEQYHVDHIEPLNGKNVSGLNVPWNLQILTARENKTKANKLLTNLN